MVSTMVSFRGLNGFRPSTGVPILSPWRQLPEEAIRDREAGPKATVRSRERNFPNAGGYWFWVGPLMVLRAFAVLANPKAPQILDFVGTCSKASRIDEG